MALNTRAESLVDWTRVAARLRARRAQLRFCLRMTLVVLLSFAVSQLLTIPLHGLWVVLTAVVVTQMSAGGSLRATGEYMIGTLSGVVYAGALGVLIPHQTVIEEGGLLALTIAPLALIAAIKPSFRVAPFTAVLVLLISGQLGQGPIESALNRLIEVALGGVIAMAVSLLVLPQRAYSLALEAATRILVRMAELLPELLDGFCQNLDSVEIGRSQDEIGRAVIAFQATAAEARSERMVKLVAEPDEGPMSRTLLRLRHDLVILGRAAAIPLPDVFARRLRPRLTELATEATKFLRGSATALTRRRNPPPLDAMDAALQSYVSEVVAMRREGLTRALSIEEAERVFTLAFALEQLYRNFGDLERCVKEHAEHYAGRRSA
jgi:uncharacterized membrane protein YccC